MFYIYIEYYYLSIYILRNILRIGYCDIFNLELLNFFQEPDLPVTRVHLTIITI